MKTLLSNRDLLAQAPRLVIKVGSSSLTAPDGQLAMEQLRKLVRAVAKARSRGQEVVIVSSGSVAAGIRPLGFNRRPKDVRDQQAAAMVGQSRLMRAYSDEFAKFGITVGQALITPEDVLDRRHYANAQAALRRLLSFGVVPIVNENDAVVTDALRFGDNDRLASLMAHLVDATALILLTDVDGLYTAPPSKPGARFVSEVTNPAQLTSLQISGKGSDVGTGGMATKVRAARVATSGGVATLLANAQNVEEILDGARLGTWFVPRSKRQPSRALWLRYAAQVQGTIEVDDGAAAALRSGGASLLAVGMTNVKGNFAAGDLVVIKDHAGKEVARGLSAYSKTELRKYIDTGKQAPRPVVHADDLVLPAR